eukprot:CAMPEP_0174743702 /NCGR_PEP_ID=MMETSP1094-20130205/82289_1 /TAXON_ID=156173 /ORGANISM="Chrysochromulina brevifilum, Strain UTEX LB 985" /LENGTH=205 /DNA_ID=CAMNT_0015947965 /DNA_START=99 /DNA_END=712 /DNA_ORIENTATION=-
MVIPRGSSGDDVLVDVCPLHITEQLNLMRLVHARCDVGLVDKRDNRRGDVSEDQHADNEDEDGEERGRVSDGEQILAEASECGYGEVERTKVPVPNRAVPQQHLGRKPLGGRIVGHDHVSGPSHLTVWWNLNKHHDPVEASNVVRQAKVQEREGEEVGDGKLKVKRRTSHLPQQLLEVSRLLRFNRGLLTASSEPPKLPECAHGA